MSVAMSDRAHKSLRIVFSPWSGSRLMPARIMGTPCCEFKRGRRASRVLQGASRQQQVLPRLRLFGKAAQEICGVVCDDERDVAIAMDFSAQAREARLGIEQAR